MRFMQLNNDDSEMAKYFMHRYGHGLNGNHANCEWLLPLFCIYEASILQFFTENEVIEMICETVVCQHGITVDGVQFVAEFKSARNGVKKHEIFWLFIHITLIKCLHGSM